MMTAVLPALAPGAIQAAVSCLRRGGLVAFPTDTVYGLGAVAADAGAVARLYRAKGRDQTKAIPLLLATAEWTEPARGVVKGPLPGALTLLAARFWPGPLTLVLARGPAVADIVTGGGPTVAVRVPNHPVALQLLTSLEVPLAVSSANRSGEPSPQTAQAVLSQLEGQVDLVLDGGASPGGISSTVVDLTSQPPQVLRPGPISAQVLNLLLATAPGVFA